MNPLRPSPRLLRRLSHLVASSDDPAVSAWAAAVQAIPAPKRSSTFPHTSVVQTFRNQRLCGFEVWRHLDSNDPTRRKARLWFGCRRHGRRRALQMAYYAAATLSKMSQPELRDWWDEYQAARSTQRPVSNLWRDETRFNDGLDYEDREKLFCAVGRAV